MKVTIIIPYKIDRGFLQDAITSVPSNVQLIVSQGEGNWPQNFNKAFPQATGEYIKYLHEDDILSPNCITDSLACFEETGADFIHGNAVEIGQHTGRTHLYVPSIKTPTLSDLLKKNVLHSPTLMYHRRVFEKVGLFNEDNKMYSFEEFEFNLRVLKAGFKIGYCPTVLAYYRRHNKQIIRTRNVLECKKNRQELVNLYA